MTAKPTRPMQWRSLDQLADAPAFRRFMEREFPAVTDLSRGPERRQFLKLMAASLALAGLAGCDDQEDGRDIEVPFVVAPERAEPGAKLHFASLALTDGLANGVLVTTRDGRPLKIEGNPEHPWSRGGTDAFGQASVLELYDPMRSQSVLHQGEIADWHGFTAAMVPRLSAIRAGKGAGLRLLTGPITSPTLLAQISAMRAALPAMRWHSHLPVSRDALYEGTRRAFGRPLEPHWHIDRARVLVTLDGDFLDPGPSQVGLAQDWAAARRASSGGSLLQLHAAASIPNLTSAKADHPLVATPAEIAVLAQWLLNDLSQGAPPPAISGSPLAQWRARAGAALHANRGASLVMAGPTAPPSVQEAVHRLNAALGNVGSSVSFSQPVVAIGEKLAPLMQAMVADEVSALIVLDANPSYDAPGDGFDAALSHVGLKIHAGLYADETASRSDWHLPLAHPLEAWGDARSPDGTIGLMQPTTAPLGTGRTVSEIMSLLFDDDPKAADALLRAHHQGSQDDAAFAPAWEMMLRAGFIEGSALPVEDAPPVAAGPVPALPASGLMVLFRPDPTVWDGRLANNGWLQELPKPLTKLVWENVLTISPALASREKLATGDIVTLAVGGSSIDAPVWVLPGQADGTVGATLGYGHRAPELLSAGIGYDATRLRGDNPWQAAGATLRKTGRVAALATTQDHNTMEGHAFVRVQREGAASVGDAPGLVWPSLYPKRPATDTAWGMVIDLDTCIGCNACVVACQSENNIAVVGREQVAMGREMHWLRIDRYYQGPPEAPVTLFQPVPCMNCEDAPCEVGCPVEATQHDSEGLNVMVYNRCIGTRACSGYCPYKVRHFNYLDYSGGAAPSLQLQRNPEVTVRARGVMEKCTYCIQRIETARIDADKRDGDIVDGTVTTACQGACPTRAISFGNLADANSKVSLARAVPRNYALLGELGAKPRTSYLAARAPLAGT